MRKPKPKQMTLDEIASVYSTTISDINTTINTAYNKIVHSLITEKNVDAWDAISGLKNFFGLTEKESIEKLNAENKTLIQRYIRERR